MKKQLLIIGVVVAITGCTINSSDEFTCPSAEKGICMPAKDAYEHAELGKDASSSSLYHSKQDKREEAITGNIYSDVAPVVGVMTKPLSQPKPVLERAQVLRVWVNAWEDENNVLHMPQDAFVEITPRRWSLTKSKVNSFKSSSPFKKVNKTIVN
ncbi:type IV conjugative transfer system lipoprotein TraV [Thalassotalea piscium]|uniref:Type IV conjugative transfer system lipoprotein TraV n=1 Tax=Thalassotalea piscium TaxID=1230533 RepID=A0A7X0NGL0_9GAMM|nr:type IV conjugative transfer system lipoprotein TraV [Thalassotalea piscium]MBB6543063.1 type IV conjugative transfer system lipoprotein TraV [Thalassotalea piscium]